MLDFFHRPGHPEGLDVVLSLAQAGRVDQPELYPVDIQYFFDGVAGGAGNLGHDGALLIEQGVEQGAFAGIGPPGDDGGYTGFQGIAQREGLQQGVQISPDCPDQSFQILAIGELDVFFAKIEFEFHQTGEVDQLCAKTRDLVFETATQLAEGYCMGRFTLAGDQVGYGFRLREVQLAVQESPQGKLAGLGQARPGAQT